MSTAAGRASAFDVREARPEDVPALVAFNHAMAAETEGKDLERERLTAGTRAVLADPGKGRYFVAVERERGAPVASLLVTREWSDWRNGVFWWIQSVYVVPEQRRRGVFRALYAHVLERARAQGDVCGLRLYVEHENAPAQAVYRSLGMRPCAYRMFEVDFVLGAEPSSIRAR